MLGGQRHGAANDVGETALDLCKVKSNTEVCTQTCTDAGVGLIRMVKCCAPVPCVTFWAAASVKHSAEMNEYPLQVAKVIVNGAARQALKAGSWSEAAKLLAALSEQADDVVNIEYEGETLLDLAVASCNEEAAASLIAMGGTKGRANTADSSYPTVSIPCVPPPPATTETSPHPHIQQADADQLKRADRRALVIGGTQFMGRLTVQALDEAGWEVVMITRGRSKNPHPPSAFPLSQTSMLHPRCAYASFSRGLLACCAEGSVHRLLQGSSTSHATATRSGSDSENSSKSMARGRSSSTLSRSTRLR